MAENTKKENSFDKFIPALLVISIALAFLVGVLWQKVSNLESGNVTAAKKADTVDEAPSGPVEGKLTAEQVAQIAPITDKDHFRGSQDAQVVLLEYSDTECPFCKRYHETIKQLVEEYDGQVAWVYRHFPLDMLHQKARAEANATECAADLGGNDKFWAMLDSIYETTTSNDGLDLAQLPKMAAAIGINQTAFEACVKSEKFKDVVEEQYQSGVTAGVSGTPGSFVMNKKGEVWSIPGALPLEEVKKIVDQALAS